MAEVFTHFEQFISLETPTVYSAEHLLRYKLLSHGFSNFVLQLFHVQIEPIQTHLYNSFDMQYAHPYTHLETPDTTGWVRGGKVSWVS